MIKWNLWWFLPIAVPYQLRRIQLQQIITAADIAEMTLVGQ